MLVGRLLAIRFQVSRSMLDSSPAEPLATFRPYLVVAAVFAVVAVVAFVAVVAVVVVVAVAAVVAVVAAF